MQQTISNLIRSAVIESAHDISDGGLFITLLESSFTNNLGFEIIGCSEGRDDAFLFSESPSRVVVSVTESGEDYFLDMLKVSSTPFMLVGHVTKGKIIVDDKHFGMVEDYKRIYNNSLEKKLNN